MQTITMEEAISDFPNMVTVLRCFAPLLKGRTTQVLMVRDIQDASMLYVDGGFDDGQLNTFYMKNVPDRIANSEFGDSGVVCNDGILPTRYIDVTDIAKEIWNEV